ncbi:hypothetical protein [Rhizobacter sp. Root404]|jgi:hypothetical protein|nr:hypothetical protein [Rhizobacter sp. Root404]
MALFWAWPLDAPYQGFHVQVAGPAQYTDHYFAMYMVVGGRTAYSA